MLIYVEDSLEQLNLTMSFCVHSEKMATPPLIPQLTVVTSSPFLCNYWTHPSTPRALGAPLLFLDMRALYPRPYYHYYHNETASAPDSVSLQVRPVQQFTSAQVFFGLEKELQVAHRHFFDPLPQRHLTCSEAVVRSAH